VEGTATQSSEAAGSGFSPPTARTPRPRPTSPDRCLSHAAVYRRIPSPITNHLSRSRSLLSACSPLPSGAPDATGAATSRVLHTTGPEQFQADRSRSPRRGSCGGSRPHRNRPTADSRRSASHRLQHAEEHSPALITGVSEPPGSCLCSPHQLPTAMLALSACTNIMVILCGKEAPHMVTRLVRITWRPAHEMQTAPASEP